jgi:hypothetical protein
MLKKLSGIVLIFALAFNLCGPFIFFQSIRYSIRREVKKQIKEGIPDNQLILFTFEKDGTGKGAGDLIWYEDDEFSYHGDMYDVVRSREFGNQIFYYCLKDTDESQAFVNLDKLTDLRTKQDKNCQSKTQLMLRLLITEGLVKPQTIFDGESFYKILNYNYLFSLCKNDTEIPTPPPRNYLLNEIV